MRLTELKRLSKRVMATRCERRARETASATSRPLPPEAMRFVLPLPPSANDYWVIGWHRRKPCLILSTEARAYKTAIALKGRVERRVPLEGPVELRLWIHFADRRSDLSNRIKVLEDALQGVAYVNDKQVNRLVAERGSEAFPPHVEVQVLPWVKANHGGNG